MKTKGEQSVFNYVKYLTITHTDISRKCKMCLHTSAYGAAPRLSLSNRYIFFSQYFFFAFAIFFFNTSQLMVQPPDSVLVIVWTVPLAKNTLTAAIQEEKLLSGGFPIFFFPIQEKILSVLKSCLPPPFFPPIQEKLLSGVSRTRKLFTFLGNDAAAFHRSLILLHRKLLVYEALSY
jgi:hypothetical protein